MVNTLYLLLNLVSDRVDSLLCKIISIQPPSQGANITMSLVPGSAHDITVSVLSSSRLLHSLVSLPDWCHHSTSWPTGLMNLNPMTCLAS